MIESLRMIGAILLGGILLGFVLMLVIFVVCVIQDLTRRR